jgi:hypothetical protein
MDTLAALCDILDCKPNDLIEIGTVNAEVRKPLARRRLRDKFDTQLSQVCSFTYTELGGRFRAAPMR